MARKELKKNTDIIDLSFEDNYEENGFDTAAGGIPLSSFSFSEDNTQAVLPEKLDEVPSCNKGNAGGLIDNRAGKPCANGITPPVDGEVFNISRTYLFRKSTVRKLNELKARHPDVNAYLSTILDAAINHYYNYIINENRSPK